MDMKCLWMDQRKSLFELNSDSDDGLTNKEEYEKFTNPFSNDTDGDDLTDKEEIDIGTNL